MRDYKSANSKWKFERIINKYGTLYYTFDVQGAQVNRHVYHFRPVSEKVQDNDSISEEYRKFRTTPSLLEYQKAECFTCISQIFNEEPTVSPSTMMPQQTIRLRQLTSKIVHQQFPLLQMLH